MLAVATLAHADERIKNRVAEFYGIDKITGRIISFDVYVDETVRFGQLHVTPRVCYSRPASETPKTTAFLKSMKSPSIARSGGYSRAGCLPIRRG